MIKCSLWLLCLILPYQGMAVERYPLPPKQQRIFNTLINDYRCLVCQNQTLADSQADLAQDLKALIYHKLKAGESPQMIEHDLTSRYGDYIRYHPPLDRRTWLLWLAPWLTMGAALMIWRRRQPKHDDA